MVEIIFFFMENNDAVNNILLVFYVYLTVKLLPNKYEYSRIIAETYYTL